MTTETHRHRAPDGWIVVDYDRDGMDVYTVKFSGELLRSDDLDWQELAKALQGMARG